MVIRWRIEKIFEHFIKTQNYNELNFYFYILRKNELVHDYTIEYLHHMAIKYGDIKLLQMLLDNDISIKTKDILSYPYGAIGYNICVFILKHNRSNDVMQKLLRLTTDKRIIEYMYNLDKTQVKNFLFSQEKDNGCGYLLCNFRNNYKNYVTMMKTIWGFLDYDINYIRLIIDNLVRDLNNDTNIIHRPNRIIRYILNDLYMHDSIKRSYISAYYVMSLICCGNNNFKMFEYFSLIDHSLYMHNWFVKINDVVVVPVFYMYVHYIMFHDTYNSNYQMIQRRYLKKIVPYSDVVKKYIEIYGHLGFFPSKELVYYNPDSGITTVGVTGVKINIDIANDSNGSNSSNSSNGSNGSNVATYSSFFDKFTRLQCKNITTVRFMISLFPQYFNMLYSQKFVVDKDIRLFIYLHRHHIISDIELYTKIVNIINRPYLRFSYFKELVKYITKRTNFGNALLENENWHTVVKKEEKEEYTIMLLKSYINSSNIFDQYIAAYNRLDIVSIKYCSCKIQLLKTMVHLQPKTHFMKRLLYATIFLK